MAFGLFFVGVDLGGAAAGGSVLWVALGVQVGALPTTLFGAPRRRGRRRLAIDDPALPWPVALLTVLNLSGDAFLAYAVTRGDLAVVSVLASLAPVVTALLAVALTAERPGGPQTAGYHPGRARHPGRVRRPGILGLGIQSSRQTSEEDPMATLTEGAQAPTFTLPDQDGNPVSLDDFKGSRVLVYFYPADDTPGCTKEACQFNDNLAGFQAAGVPVIGISRRRRQPPALP